VGQPGRCEDGRRRRVARSGALRGDDLPRPSAVVMAYTALQDHSSDDPPTFVVVGDRDGIAPPATMRRRAEALRRSGTAVEYHEYEGVGHSFGLGEGTIAEGWVGEAVRFWERAIGRW
jgi:acetyl esterase/lipase